MTSAKQSTQGLIKYSRSIALLTAFLAWFGIFFLVLFFTIIVGIVLIGLVVTLFTAGSVERLAYGLPAVFLGTTVGIVLGIPSRTLYSATT
jgi:Flp pilus assembly protein TadB